MSARILLVEDNRELAKGIAYNLELEGYAVSHVEDGEAALRVVTDQVPDIIILDVMLPGIDGFQVLRRLRERRILVPVMMLTARAEETDQVRAFRLDADQYVTKPFRLMELIERVNMMVRRSVSRVAAPPPSQPVLRFGNVEVDAASRRVQKSGREVVLTPKAFDLLIALAAGQARVLSRQELLRQVWKHQADVVTRTVDSHVSELRHKLEDDPEDPRHIVTVWKAGYRFEA